MSPPAVICLLFCIDCEMRRTDDEKLLRDGLRAWRGEGDFPEIGNRIGKLDAHLPLAHLRGAQVDYSALFSFRGCFINQRELLPASDVGAQGDQAAILIYRHGESVLDDRTFSGFIIRNNHRHGQSDTLAAPMFDPRFYFQLPAPPTLASTLAPAVVRSGAKHRVQGFSSATHQVLAKNTA